MRIEIGSAKRDDTDWISEALLAFLDEMSILAADIAPAPDADQRIQADVGSWVADPHRLLNLARFEGSPVGLIHAQTWRLPPVYAGKEEIFVAEIYVLPEYRSNGIGKSLVNSALEWGRQRGAEGLRASVMTANDSSIAFWTALGAKSVVADYSIDIDADPRRSVRKRARLGF